MNPLRPSDPLRSRTVDPSTDVRGPKSPPVEEKKEKSSVTGLAPTSVARGETYHQRSIAGTGPSALVGIRMQQREPDFKTPPAQRLKGLIEGALGHGSTNRVKAANELLDAFKDHLIGRSERTNRSGDGYQLLAQTPVEERIPLLRRAVHALRTAAKEGVLPPRSLQTVNSLAKMSQGMGWNFDWDDNIANMATKLVLFNKKDGSERQVSTDEFAVIRGKVGKEGEWADFEVRGDDQVDGSFRNFRDLGDASVFSRDMEYIKTTPGWKGPSFADFQKAMAHETTAKWSTIITARGHYPNTIHAELQRMKEEGLIKHTLPEENIYPVSLPGLAQRLHGSVQSPSEAKVKVMEKYLDRLEASPFGPSTRLVVPPDGTEEKRYLHLWGFSDDDHGTFEKTKEVLGEEVKKGRWPNTKITVFFTGQNHPEVPPHAVVVKPDGTTRPQLPEEVREVDKILDRISAYQKTLG